MTKLSSLDSSFLRVETPTAHMHVGWLSHLDLPDGTDRLDVERLKSNIEARLHLAPRFRQLVVEPPLGLGEPEWCDDPGFELDRHVSVCSATPIGRHALRAIADDFLSFPLPRDRPLWGLLVVPRVGPDGAAILGKVHHAMVDGIAAVELGMLLFDIEPEPKPAADDAPPPLWAPRPTAPAARRAFDALAHDAGRRARAAGSVVRMGSSPRAGLKAATRDARPPSLLQATRCAPRAIRSSTRRSRRRARLRRRRCRWRNSTGSSAPAASSSTTWCSRSRPGRCASSRSCARRSRPTCA
jgi:hypothetical protein